ncbi:MAG: ABC transporter permease, partial [Candidatus Eremiobacteraeota bacterium]|nr:ABC transporter permease [Candidatus Eremiobacteraeota bacterium]
MTRILAYLGEALTAIWRNRTRSLLTMLGMIIGTSSVIAVLGISKGAQNGIGSTISSFGDPGYSVAVDNQQDDPGAAQIQYRDAQVVAETTSGITTGVYP